MRCFVVFVLIWFASETVTCTPVGKDGRTARRLFAAKQGQVHAHNVGMHGGHHVGMHTRGANAGIQVDKNANAAIGSSVVGSNHVSDSHVDDILPPEPVYRSFETDSSAEPHDRAGEDNGKYRNGDGQHEDQRAYTNGSSELPMDSTNSPEPVGKRKRKRNGKTDSRFANASAEEVEKLKSAAVPRNTQRADQWALTTFFEWMETTLKRAPPSCIHHIPTAELGELLCKFFHDVRKQDNSLYPASTLNKMFYALNRAYNDGLYKDFLHKRRDTQLKYSFNTHPDFIISKNAMTNVMRSNATVEPVKPTKKAMPTSRRNESEILNDAVCSPNNPSGLVMRFMYYVFNRFAVRGRLEAYSLLRVQFKFGTAEKGNFIEYDPNMCKNHQLGVGNCNPDKLRKPLRWNERDDPDMYRTFCAYYSQLPPMDTDAPLLLNPKTQWTGPTTDIWYSVNRKGINSVGSALSDMCLSANVERTTNQSGRATMVTRFQLHNVPIEVGMSITGHKSVEAYLRYDHSQHMQKRAAQICLNDDSRMWRADGSRKNYHDVLQELVSELYEDDSKVRDTVPDGNTDLDVAAATATNVASHISSAGLKDNYVADFLYKPQECQKSTFANTMLQHVRKHAPTIDVEAVRQTINVLMLHGLPISRFDASYLPKEDLFAIDAQFEHVIAQTQVPSSEAQSAVPTDHEEAPVPLSDNGSDHPFPVFERDANFGNASNFDQALPQDSGFGTVPASFPVFERDANVGNDSNFDQPLPQDSGFGTSPASFQTAPSDQPDLGQDLSEADWDMIVNNLPNQAKQLFAPRQVPQTDFVSNVAPQFSNCHGCTINLTVAPSLGHWPNFQPNIRPQ